MQEMSLFYAVLSLPVIDQAAVFVRFFKFSMLAPGDVVGLDNLRSHKVLASGTAYLPGSLQSRSQPDQADALQAENAAAQGRWALRRGNLEADWFTPRPLHPWRMPAMR